MHGGSASFLFHYEELVSSGEIERDFAQQSAASAFSALEERLVGYRPVARQNLIGRLFGNGKRAEPIKGLYIHGEVGRGKTMLMDLFFDASPVEHKRRAHFHERVNRPTGRARIGSPARKRCRSSASSPALA